MSNSITPSDPDLSSSQQISNPRTPFSPQAVKMSRSFFILPPYISEAEKILYKPVNETSLKSAIEIEVDEVIGQYREDGILYYFARYKGGIAHKFPSKPFVVKYGGLVEEYKRKMLAGHSQPFDPSAHYVHPLSRVGRTLNISKRRAAVNTSSAVSDSQEEGTRYESESDIRGSEDDYDESSVPRKSLTKSKKTLPFSPKKTRSRRIFLIDSDQDFEVDNYNSITSPPARRSARTRKGVKVNLDTETYTDESEPSDEGSGSYDPRDTTIRIKREKQPIRKKIPRPAYGRFRAIEDLDYDSSNGEDAPLWKHREKCEKCHRGPAHKCLRALLKKGKAKNSRRKKTPDDDFEQSDEDERFKALGGWVRCLKCPVVCHWQCLAVSQRDEILRAAMNRDQADWHHSRRNVILSDDELSPPPEPGKRLGLNINQTTEFICNACMKGGVCMGCMKVALQPDDSLATAQKETHSTDIQLGDTMMSDKTRNSSLGPSKPANEDASADPYIPTTGLLFRCLTCKRIAHYEHLPFPSHLRGSTVAEVAQFYTQTWLCADCSSYRDSVDKIIAWRPNPPNAVEPPRSNNEPPNYRNSLPREYLVKWSDRSYRRIQWVPHMWLVSTHPSKLRNFLSGGSKVELLKNLEVNKEVVIGEELAPTFEIGNDSRASSTKPGNNTPVLPQTAIPDADRRIPLAWKTIDRVLDVLLWHPHRQQGKHRQSNKMGKQRIEVDHKELDNKLDESIEEERILAFDQGEQPSDDLTETISEWEARTNCAFSLDNIEQVVWAFIKWEDLGYDEATWDSPPRPADPTYKAFRTAMKRFIDARQVIVPKHTQSYCKTFDNRAKDEYRNRHALKNAADLDIGQNPQLRLMPFQVDGFNWLCNNWWTHQHCILADEMGLGKTVQVTTFLGNIAANFKAFPALVVVPNSTITNWVREFERWAPNLRVVPFYGEAKARKIIKKFELYHEVKRFGETGAKFHVLVTTYEALLNPTDFTPVFKNQSRWEVLVVDEGQRLKSDTSLLFKRLNELNSVHRVIMTGTPLNNKIRELFNLMNFLDPDEWNDLESLEKEHEELTEDLVKQLHNRLRPYFLRRIKSEVLQLPPKNEVIVPVSMTPLQKEVYRSILSHNLELLNGLTQPSTSKLTGSVSKGRLNNVLMHLRKCLQHPYLYAEDIEPRGLSPAETHEKLIDGSAKLRFLKTMLPKLRERGHRVLLFSQFVIALDVIEDFLVGEGFKYLRLDGSTKGSERQKGMDEFNKTGSDVFIYLLTTRAGGVGINLFSADTVIIFDPDFNPHQDLQAIARAHRFGQQKTCLVFKLMVKDSAEERIIQVGKKKLVLDHLIVQKMDDEDSAGEDVQSILTYGAKALFDADENVRDITYTEYDIEKLVEKTEQEGEQEEQRKEGMSFSFAKIWAADKDSLEEVQDVDQGDSWAQTLQKITVERNKTQSQEVTKSGRGVRRRAAALPKPNAYRDEPSKEKSKKPGASVASDGSAYQVSDAESDGGVTSDATEDLTFEPSHPKLKVKPFLFDHGSRPSENPIHNPPPHDVQFCGLCARRHGSGAGECVMTDHSEHLAEFREMLLLHADDEPWEERVAAIEAIDKTLQQRGHIHLIAGQPLHPLQSSFVRSIPQGQETKDGALRLPGPKLDVQQPGSFSKFELSHLGGPTSPHQWPKDTAGSSKRPTPTYSAEGQPKAKKTKLSSYAPPSLPLPCLVCGQSPHHLVKDCPLVIEGSQSISAQINRLENNPGPGTADTVKILRMLLLKQRRREITTDATNMLND